MVYICNDMTGFLKRTLRLVAMLALTIFFSCEKESQDTIVLKSANNILFPVEGGTETITFTASGSWRADATDYSTNSLSWISQKPWLSVTPNHGTTTGRITVTATANTEEKDRMAIVIITCGTASETVIITQARQSLTTGTD